MKKETKDDLIKVFIDVLRMLPIFITGVLIITNKDISKGARSIVTFLFFIYIELWFREAKKDE